MAFAKTDKSGETASVSSDSFDAADYINQIITMEAYGERIKRGNVKAVHEGNTYDIITGTAKLTVRGATSGVEYMAGSSRLYPKFLPVSPVQRLRRVPSTPSTLPR